MHSFVDNSTRNLDHEYILNMADIAKVPPVTSSETIEINTYVGQMDLHIIHGSPAGRFDRSKWIDAFQNVTSIIFSVDLSCYDEVLPEEPTKTRMLETLFEFDSIVNSKWFARTGIILMLCNVARFEAKLNSTHLEKYWSDYSGGNDADKAAKYLLWTFNRANRAQLNIYPDLIDLRDDTDVRLVLVALKEQILQNALNNKGVLWERQTALTMAR
jgi:guanine nucleotide-binding protein G(i) subunit alpha